MKTSFDLSVWVPYYNFFLQSVAFSYPREPNNVLRRKYYDFYSNFSLFIPDPKAFTTLNKILDANPVMPYLDSQLLLLKWTHKITNELNALIGVDAVDFHAFMEAYYNMYKPREIVDREKIKRRERIVFALVMGLGILSIGTLIHRGVV